MNEYDDENTEDEGDKKDEGLSFFQNAPIFSEIDIVLSQNDSLFISQQDKVAGVS